MEPVKIITKTMAMGDAQPADAYAKLRTYTPGRPSYLFESQAPETPAGRYSVVAYRVRSGSMLPPGVDAIGAQFEELAQQAAPGQFAEALALGCAGYFNYSNGHTINGIKHWPDEACSGYFLTGAVVMLFDHQQSQIVVAGPEKGRFVDRCVWEFENGPPPPPLAPSQAADEPANISAKLGEEKLAARVARAKRAVPVLVEQLVMAESFLVGMGDSDPFDAYRAMRADSGNTALKYFIDFGVSPVAPAMQVFGWAPRLLALQRHGQTEPSAKAVRDVLRDNFPRESAIGKPALEAAKMVRRLEDSTRDLLGGAIGYACPGGAAAFAPLDELVIAHAGSYELPVGVKVDADSEPAPTAAAAKELAKNRLTALAAALQLAPKKPVEAD